MSSKYVSRHNSDRPMEGCPIAWSGRVDTRLSPPPDEAFRLIEGLVGSPERHKLSEPQQGKLNQDVVNPGTIEKPLGHGANFTSTVRDLGEDVS